MNPPTAAPRQPRRAHKSSPRPGLSLRLALPLALLVCLAAAAAAVDPADTTPADAAPATALTNRTRQAYVSLIYGDTYALAVRVSMHSLRRNSPDVAAGRRDRVVLATGHTSAAAKQQMLSDGIRVITVPELETPYSSDPKFRERFRLVMTKLLVFNLTEYHSVVFLDADTLVLGDLSPLFSCGDFCAVFINPCHFNSGLMHVVPNTTLFNDIVRELPNLESYDGGDQGFLNSYFTNMSRAPLFNPDAPAEPRPAFNRLSFDWHTDHSSFFPTFDFSFARSDRCGSPKVVEWLGPPMLKPWLWWTYALLDLSWRWLDYRRELADAFPPAAVHRRNGMLLVVGVYVVLLVLARLCYARSTRPLPPLFTTLARLGYILPRPPPRLAAAFAVLLGLPLWALGFALSMSLVPELLQPLPASIVFVHVRFLFSLAALLVVGPALGLRGSRVAWGTHSAPAKAARARKLVGELVVWAAVDAAYLVAWSGVLWRLPFPGFVERVAFGAMLALTNVALVAVMFGRTSLMWLRFADVR